MTGLRYKYLYSQKLRQQVQAVIYQWVKKKKWIVPRYISSYFQARSLLHSQQKQYNQSSLPQTFTDYFYDKLNLRITSLLCYPFISSNCYFKVKWLVFCSVRQQIVNFDLMVFAWTLSYSFPPVKIMTPTPLGAFPHHEKKKLYIIFYFDYFIFCSSYKRPPVIYIPPLDKLDIRNFIVYYLAGQVGSNASLQILVQMSNTTAHCN